MKFKSTVTALAALVTFSIPVSAETTDRAAELLNELSEATSPAIANRLERELMREWSKSGSASMNLLLKRGQDAIEVQDLHAAIEHLTALTDHAPHFAEGWHALALAYYQDERFGPAVDALERTLALNPHHFGALRGLGAVMEQVGRPEVAYEAYSRVIEMRPHDESVKEALDRLEVRVKGTAL